MNFLVVYLPGASKGRGSDHSGCGFKYRNLKASGCTGVVLILKPKNLWWFQILEFKSLWGCQICGFKSPCRKSSRSLKAFAGNPAGEAGVHNNIPALSCIDISKTKKPPSLFMIVEGSYRYIYIKDKNGSN